MNEQCAFCGSSNVDVADLVTGETWLMCHCGHITKILPNGKRELWVGEGDSIVISKVRDLE